MGQDAHAARAKRRIRRYAIVAPAVALCTFRLSAQSLASGRGDLDSGVHEATINGARLWYRVAGNPSSPLPPVVFLHGGPGYNSYSFAALEGPRLETTLRMVYFDQRGSGQSERPANGDYAMSTLVNDVEGLRVALGVKQIALIGHSFGGVLALEYAARYQDRVSHLVLVSTPADLPASCAVRKARLLELHPELRTRADSVRAASDCELEFRLLRGADHEAFSNAIMFPDSMLRKRQDSVDAASGLRNTGELGSALMRNGLLSYRFNAQQRLTMPVLIVAGGRDASVGVQPQQRFAQLLRHAQFVSYDGAGHFVYLDEPNRFARDVIAFISRSAQ
jgi:proline iminopeptidase